MIRLILILLGAIVLGADPGGVAVRGSLIAAPAAQAKPDFSGQWILESASQSSPANPRALTVRQAPARTDARGEPISNTLTVERELESGRVSDTYHIGLIGGVVAGTAGLPDRGGRESESGPFTDSRFEVRWDGNRLIIQTGRYSGPAPESGPYTERTEVWWLDGEGRLVMTVTDRGSERKAATRTLVYRRQ